MLGLRYVTAALACLLLLLTGCSELEELVAGPDSGSQVDNDPPDPGATADDEQRERGKPDRPRGPGGGRSGDADGPGSLPGGLRDVTAADTGLRLGVPASWVLVDAERLADDAFVGRRLAGMLEKSGLTVEQLRPVIRQIEVMVIGPDGSNVSILPGRLLAEVPTPSALRAQLTAIGAADISVADRRTPLGSGRVARYRLEAGGAVQHGAQLYVMLPDGPAVVTVSTPTPERGDQLLDLIVPTLARTGDEGHA